MTLERTPLGDVRSISRYPVLSTATEPLAEHLLATVRSRRKAVLFFANTNFVVNCRFLLDRHDEIPVTIVNDGIGLDIASLMLHGRRFSYNLNGTDFVPSLFRRSPRPLRVFMLGARADVLAAAVRHVRDDLGQNVVGSADGFSGVDSPGLIDAMNAAAPEVVLVALGNPKQERWIVDNAPLLDAQVYVGVGALFDFWAGDKRRAPAPMRRLHLEWLYRLYLEPRRLMRRYTLDILVFLRQCLRYR